MNFKLFALKDLRLFLNLIKSHQTKTVSEINVSGTLPGHLKLIENKGLLYLQKYQNIVS